MLVLHEPVTAVDSLTEAVIAGRLRGRVPHVARLWFALEQFKTPLHEALVAGTTSRLEKARDTCAPNSIYAEVGDDGDTLILRFRGKERSGLDMSTLDCFMTELEVTDAVRSEIGATRALDGRRSADWGGYHGSWSYHPDSGLNMTITVR